MVFAPKRQLPRGVTTANNEFLDALIRHQIGLLRLSGSIRDDIHKILDATEADIAKKIRRGLARNRGLTTPADVTRLNTLLKSIKVTRLTALNQVTKVWLKEIVALAVAEPKFIDGALKTTVPVVIETVLPSISLLKSIVTTRPFQGKVMKDWAKQFTRNDLRRMEEQIKIGLVQGESSQDIARRIVGTKAQRGRNGIFEVSRREATGITRTAVNAVSNQAKREFYRSNATMFTKELYVATLDSRTTLICSSLDGETFPIAEGPIPPLHFMCRSLRVAVLDQDVLGRRPAREFTQKQLVREFVKENKLPKATSRKALPRGQLGKFDTFSRARMRELTGTVPAKVSYQQWLGRQSAAFQDDVLGPTRGRLFRRGEVKLDRFVNRAGDSIPLSELARIERKAFFSAGLDPEDFL